MYSLHILHWVTQSNINANFFFTKMIKLTTETVYAASCLPFQGGGSDVVSVSCFGVRVSVMFHFMFVHYTFSSVWVAEWPPFGK